MASVQEITSRAKTTALNLHKQLTDQVGPINSKVNQLGRIYSQYQFQQSQRLQDFRKTQGDKIAQITNDYFQKYGGVLNDKAIQFLMESSDIGVPTLTSIMAGYEVAKKSAADMEEKLLEKRIAQLNAETTNRAIGVAQDDKIFGSRIAGEQENFKKQIKDLEDQYGIKLDYTEKSADAATKEELKKPHGGSYMDLFGKPKSSGNAQPAAGTTGTMLTPEQEAEQGFGPSRTLPEPTGTTLTPDQTTTSLDAADQGLGTPSAPGGKTYSTGGDLTENYGVGKVVAPDGTVYTTGGDLSGTQGPTASTVPPATTDFVSVLERAFSNDHNDVILKASEETGVNPVVAKALAQTESTINPGAKSGAGAEGLYQLTPVAVTEINRMSPGTIEDPLNPDQNAKGGLLYYKKQLDTFGDPLKAYAAYHSGPTRVKRLESKGINIFSQEGRPELFKGAVNLARNIGELEGQALSANDIADQMGIGLDEFNALAAKYKV